MNRSGVLLFLLAAALVADPGCQAGKVSRRYQEPPPPDVPATITPCVAHKVEVSYSQPVDESSKASVRKVPTPRRFVVSHRVTTPSSPAVS